MSVPWPQEGMRRPLAPFDEARFEYMVTQNARKSWSNPPEGDGWEEIDWDRQDFTEDVLWRRPKITPQTEAMMSIVYVEDIKAALVDFYTPEESEQWLVTPHPQLDGISAWAAIKAGRKSEVWDIVNRLRDCVYL